MIHLQPVANPCILWQTSSWGIMERKRFFFKHMLAITLMVILGPQWSNADVYNHPWKNERHHFRGIALVPEIRYFSTSSNYSSDGTLVTSNGFTELTAWLFDVNGKFVINEDFTFYGRVSGASIESVHTNTARAGNQFGLTDQTAGINWLAIHSKTGIQIDFQFQWDIPAYSIGATSTQPMLGDGSHNFTAGGFFSAPVIEDSVRSLRLIGGAGFMYRTEGFSTGIPWSFSAELSQLVSGINLKATIHGHQSLEKKTTTAGTLNACAGSGAGDSCFVNSLDPSFVNFGAEISYDLSETFRIAGIYSGSILGSNAPKFWNAGISLSLQLFGKDKRSKYKRSTPESKKPDEDFVQYEPLDAKVSRVNDRLNLIKINKGSEQGVKLGEKLDIFSVTPAGKIKETIARARVTSVKENEAALKILKYYKEIWIEEGFVVKRPIE